MKQTVNQAECGFALRVEYTGPDQNMPVSVKEYMLYEAPRESEEYRAGERFCLVRLCRRDDMRIDAVTLTLTMLDAAGVELGRRDVTFRDSDLPPAAPGELFTPEGAIPVEGRCAEVLVDIREVASGDYRYRLRRGEVVLDYCPPMPWRYHAGSGAGAGLSDTVPLRVRSKRAGKVGWLWPIAFLSLLLLLVFLLLPPIRVLLVGL